MGGNKWEDTLFCICKKLKIPLVVSEVTFIYHKIKMSSH